MRYATVTLTWDAGRSNPIDDAFARDGDASLAAIRYLSPGPEGRYVQLLELRGDLDRADALLSACPDALEHDVAGAGERGVAYVQCRTAGLVDDLLAPLYDHEIVVDWPIRYLDGGGRGVEVMVVGTNRAIKRAAADLPPDVDLRLERTGEYRPGAGRFPEALTERQREVLELAVEEGYYEVPRRTTHRDLAAELDLAPGTVSEHLQRIESKLVAAFVDRGA